MALKNLADYQKDIINIDNQMAELARTKQRLIDIQNKSLNNTNTSEDSIWSKIDKEILDSDKSTLEAISNNEDYKNINNKLNAIVQQELLLLVKDKVEQREDAKSLLEKQLEIVKYIKDKHKQEREGEVMLFTKFKEYSKLHPDTTYEEFLVKCK